MWIGELKIAHAQVEDVVKQGRGVPQLRKRLIGLDQFRFSGRHIEFLRQIIDGDVAATADFFGNLRGEGFGQLIGLFLLQLQLDGRL